MNLKNKLVRIFPFLIIFFMIAASMNINITTVLADDCIIMKDTTPGSTEIKVGIQEQMKCFGIVLQIIVSSAASFANTGNIS